VYDAVVSINEPMIFLPDGPELTADVAEFIALEVAKGHGLGYLHDNYPDRIPNPMVIKRWVKNNMQFQLLMAEAEDVRAERLADESVTIADDADILAADKAQRIKARQWLASKLADRYGSAPAKDGKDSGGMVGIILTDEQLYAIAAKGLPAPDALEGESERVEDTNAAAVGSGVEGPESGTQAGEGGSILANVQRFPESDPDPLEF
jgi:hypothetical protein